MPDRDRAGGAETSRPYVALLRGINVGGRNKLPMRELAAMFVEAGCEDVRTYIQSGNVVFRADPSLADGLSARITTVIAASHGYQIPVVIRTAADLARVVRGNPLLADGADPTKLYVGFLAEASDPARVAKTRSRPLAAGCLRGARRRGLPALSQLASHGRSSRTTTSIARWRRSAPSATGAPCADCTRWQAELEDGSSSRA